MRRSASQIIRNLEMRIARLEKSAKSEPAIETSSERELEKAWPDVSYQGKGDFIDTYMGWIRTIENDEIREGSDADDTEDQFGNSLEFWNSQECYLGYVQDKDYFVMGFDCDLYSPVSAEAWSDHQEAMEEYREAYEEWEESDDEDADEPIEDDFRGYDYDYEGESDPSDGVNGWATVTFKVKNGSVIVKDVHVEAEGYMFYSDGYDHTKRTHRNIIDLRLD